MSTWNRYYTSPSHSSTFIFGELCYKKSIEVSESITGVHDSYASYVSRKDNVLSEHVRYSEDQRKANFGYKYFTDPKNLFDYFKNTLDIIEQTEKYKNDLEKIDIATLSLEDVLDLVERAAPIYYKSIGYYFLSQPEYTPKLKDEFIKELAHFVPQSEIQDVFMKLVESEKRSCLEDERLEWLTIIVKPYLEKSISHEELEKKIQKHTQSYKYLSASAQFGLWDYEHYTNLLKDDSSKKLEDIENEINKITGKEKKVLNEKNNLIEKYHIKKEVVDRIQILTDLASLRLEAHMRGWQFFQWFGPVLVKQAAVASHEEEIDVLNLTFNEFINFLKGDLKIDDKIKQRRGGDILVIVTPEKGEEIYFSEEAVKKYDSEIAEKIEHSNQFSGQVANGKGIVRGRAFVFKWGEEDINKRIYEFREGDILVAGQTLPLFMPAIRKALAIVTNEGGVLCHAAIVARELNKPAIIGTKVATHLLKDGDEIEMDLDKGIVRIIK